MRFEYLFQGGKCSLKISPDGDAFLAVLKCFAERVSHELIETAVVTFNRPATQAAARALIAEAIVKPADNGEHSYQLTKRGVALVTACYDQIMGKATEKAHEVVYTYRGVEPNILITADAASVLDQFKPYAPGIYAFEPGLNHSGVPRKTFGEMVNLGIMVNVAPDSETTLFVLTGLGRNLLQEMQHYKRLAAKPKTNPAAWRYKYADDVEESRAWSYTDEERLIMRLREDDNYIIQKLDVRKEEE